MRSLTKRMSQGFLALSTLIKRAIIGSLMVQLIFSFHCISPPPANAQIPVMNIVWGLFSIFAQKGINEATKPPTVAWPSVAFNIDLYTNLKQFYGTCVANREILAIVRKSAFIALRPAVNGGPMKKLVVWLDGDQSRTWTVEQKKGEINGKPCWLKRINSVNNTGEWTEWQSGVDRFEVILDTSDRAFVLGSHVLNGYVETDKVGKVGGKFNLSALPIVITDDVVLAKAQLDENYRSFVGDSPGAIPTQPMTKIGDGKGTITTVQQGTPAEIMRAELQRKAVAEGRVPLPAPSPSATPAPTVKPSPSPSATPLPERRHAITNAPASVVRSQPAQPTITFKVNGKLTSSVVRLQGAQRLNIEAMPNVVSTKLVLKNSEGAMATFPQAVQAGNERTLYLSGFPSGRYTLNVSAWTSNQLELENTITIIYTK